MDIDNKMSKRVKCIKYGFFWRIDMLNWYKNNWNSKKYFVFLAVVLTLLRIFLAVKTPLYGLGAAMHDDFLLVSYADSLQNFEWLGSYNNLTLAKGISFSIFLSICHLLFIPYPLGLILIWIGALLVFVAAIKNSVKDKAVLSLMYIFLLYSPATFADAYSQRIYRMSVVPAAVVFVVACLIGLFFRRNENIKKQAVWALGAGIGLSFFWYIREDSIWLFPFVLGALICSAIAGIAFQHEKGIPAIKKVIVYLLPILMLFLSNNLLSAINYKYYGIYTVSDRTGTYFSKVVSNMLKVENEDDIGPDDPVWITRKQMEEMVAACPSLKSIEMQIEQIYDSGWCTDGEISGDIIFWALRDAVAWSGKYVSAAETNRFYKNLNEELETAFETGNLKKREAFYPSSMGKGMRKEDIPFLLQRTMENLSEIVTYEQCVSQAIPGEGSWEQLRTMEAITGTVLIYPDQVGYKISGLVEPAESTGKLQVYIKKEENLTEIPVGTEFSIELKDVKDIEALQLQICQDGEYKDTVEMKTGKNDCCSIELYEIEQIIVRDPLLEKSESVISISNVFIKIYQKTAVLLAILALLGYLMIVFRTVTDIRKKQYESIPVFLVMTGLGGSMFICIAGVSWFTAWLPDYSWFTFFYTPGIIAVIQMFEIFGIYFGAKNVMKFIEVKRHKSFINF